MLSQDPVERTQERTARAFDTPLNRYGEICPSPRDRHPVTVTS